MYSKCKPNLSMRKDAKLQCSKLHTKNPWKITRDAWYFFWRHANVNTKEKEIILIVMSDRNHWIGEKEVVSRWRNSREHDKVSAYSYLIFMGIPWLLQSTFGWDKEGKIQSFRKRDRNTSGEGHPVLYVPNLSPFHSRFRRYFGISTYFSNWELPIYCVNSKSRNWRCAYCLGAESVPASWALEAVKKGRIMTRTESGRHSAV